MRAIIPVAGVGSRLRPHTYSQPKVLLNVAGKPIIAHILDKIIADGFDCATLIVGHLGDMIREYIRSNYSIHIDYIEQEEREGLAHAIYLARNTFSDEPVLIILGDTIFSVDLKPVINGSYTAIGVKHVDDPKRFGIVEVDDGFIKTLTEKPDSPKSNLAIVGLYWIRNSALLKTCIDELIQKGIKTRGEYQLTDALSLMLAKGEKMITFPVDGWYDCGKPETLLLTNRCLLEKFPISSISYNDFVVIPPVYISPKAKIKNSVIGPYATIADCVIVEDSVVRNSIIAEGAQVKRVLLENSIIGSQAMVNGAFKRINIGDSSEIEFY